MKTCDATPPLKPVVMRGDPTARARSSARAAIGDDDAACAVAAVATDRTKTTIPAACSAALSGLFVLGQALGRQRGTCRINVTGPARGAGQQNRVFPFARALLSDFRGALKSGMGSCLSAGCRPRLGQNSTLSQGSRELFPTVRRINLGRVCGRQDLHQPSEETASFVTRSEVHEFTKRRLFCRISYSPAPHLPYCRWNTRSSKTVRVERFHNGTFWLSVGRIQSEVLEAIN